MQPLVKAVAWQRVPVLSMGFRERRSRLHRFHLLILNLNVLHLRRMKYESVSSRLAPLTNFIHKIGALPLGIVSFTGYF